MPPHNACLRVTSAYTALCCKTEAVTVEVVKPPGLRRLGTTIAVFLNDVFYTGT